MRAGAATAARRRYARCYMQDSLAGQLLLASPALLDPNFSRTVVLVGVHSEEGALGVVLNRPSGVTVEEAVPQLGETVSGSEPVYIGGPVQPASVVLLAEFSDPEPAGMLVVGRIGFPAADADMEQLAQATTRRRVFAGFAGWGEGQLDAEVDQGDWIAHSALPEDVFTQLPDELWSSVMRRKGGSYALLARMPLDPSVN
jgi:putative transcriptional regulator